MSPPQSEFVSWLSDLIGEGKQFESNRAFADAAGISETSVHRILSSETYAGVWHYGKRGPRGLNDRGAWLAVDVPALVSRDVSRSSHNAGRNPQPRLVLTARLPLAAQAG